MLEDCAFVSDRSLEVSYSNDPDHLILIRRLLQPTPSSLECHRHRFLLRLYFDDDDRMTSGARRCGLNPDGRHDGNDTVLESGEL